MIVRGLLAAVVAFGLLAAPLASEAQPDRLPLVAILLGAAPWSLSVGQEIFQIESQMVSDDVKRQLRGHTIVLKCLFEVQLDDGDCTLTLDLADERTPGSSVVRVQFSSVSDLSIRKFGGGITQVMCLDIEDVREWQWDRANPGGWARPRFGVLRR